MLVDGLDSLSVVVNFVEMEVDSSESWLVSFTRANSSASSKNSSSRSGNRSCVVFF